MAYVDGYVQVPPHVRVLAHLSNKVAIVATVKIPLPPLLVVPLSDGNEAQPADNGAESISDKRQGGERKKADPISTSILLTLWRRRTKRGGRRRQKYLRICHDSSGERHSLTCPWQRRPTNTRPCTPSYVTVDDEQSSWRRRLSAVGNALSRQTGRQTDRQTDRPNERRYKISASFVPT